MRETISQALSTHIPPKNADSRPRTQPTKPFTEVLDHTLSTNKTQSLEDHAPKTPKDIQGLHADKHQLSQMTSPKLNSFQALFLSKQSLGDAPIIHLASQLKSNSSVQHLILGQNGITPFAAAALADLLKVNHHIGWLVLNSNKLGQFGAQRLAEGLAENKGVKHLIVDDNDIGDTGLAALLHALQHHPSIESIVVKQNALTDRSVDALIAFMDSHETVKRIDIRQNPLMRDENRVKLRDFAATRDILLYF